MAGNGHLEYIPVSRVFVVLVNWNGWQDTVECLESLMLLDYPDFRIVVCDNGSTDDSLQRIGLWAGRNKVSCAEYARFFAESGGDRAVDPLLTVISNGENLGFAGGNNVGIRYGMARGDIVYYWLLNNDTVVEPGALTHLVARMNEHPMPGMCGSSIRFYHDRNRIQALGGGCYYRWIGLPWHYGRFRKWKGNSGMLRKAESRMNYVEGVSMLVSHRFIDVVGLMGEDYFLYFEEADWAIRNAGRYPLGYAPRSVVYHKVGGSIGTSSNPAKKSYICDFYNIRNRLLFTRRYYPSALPSVCLVILAEFVLRLLLGKWDRAAMIMRLLLKSSSGNCVVPGAGRVES